jgi:hypothetical protein
LVLGTLTKFVPVLLIPAAVAALWRDRTRNATAKGHPETRSASRPYPALVLGILISLGLAAAFYAPFWTGLDSITPRDRWTLFTASIPKVVLDSLVRDFGLGEGEAEWYVRNAAYAIVALVALGLAVWVWRSRNAVTPEGRSALVGRILVAFYEITFVYLVVASLWFQPWYLLWLIGLTVPLAYRPQYVTRTLLFCVGGVLNYFVWDYVWLWNRTDFRTIQITSALAIYTLPVLYTLWVWLRRPS